MRGFQVLTVAFSLSPNLPQGLGLANDGAFGQRNPCCGHVTHTVLLHDGEVSNMESVRSSITIIQIIKL